MSTPKGVYQRNQYRKHYERLAGYVLHVQSVYDALNEEVSKSVMRSGYDGEKPFRFADFPSTKRKIEEVQTAFVKNLRTLIYSSTSKEWKESNLVQDLLANRVLKFYGADTDDAKRKAYFQLNEDALKAFQQRKDRGMGLSQKLWNQSKEYKDELECAISSSFERGMSATRLSKRLRGYLEDFPSLKKDYKERFGKEVVCHDSVYKSMRLARSEINMAYRTAEQERWKQFDFVLGYEVKLTQNGRHEADICDELAGKYPKDFKFMGWHPNCMCYVVSILKSEEEFWEDKEPVPVTTTPDGFNEWIEKNQERIEAAKEAGTLPYWYTDNLQFIEKAGKAVGKSETFDILAFPDGVPEKYSSILRSIQEKAETRMEDMADYEKPRMRLVQLQAKKMAEVLADAELRAKMEADGFDMERWLNGLLNAPTKYDIGGDLRLMVERYDTRVESPFSYGRTTILPAGSKLPCDMEKIAQVLNSKESLEQFFINYGYRSYEEFYEALGGLSNVEEKLRKLADESRVYMCLDASTLEKKIIKGDGKFKNSLETGKGSFKTIGEERAVKERTMFGLSADADYDVMPKYGFVAGKETMDYEDIVGFGYGDTYVRFKDAAVRSRTTITCGDSYDGNHFLRSGKGYGTSSPATPLEKPDANFTLGIRSHSFSEKDALEKWTSATKLSDIQTSTYVEAQIYGALRIEDVAAVFVQSKKQKESLMKLLKKQGLDIEVLPCKYDTRLKYLAGMSDDAAKVAKYRASLTNADIDVLGDFYIDDLCEEFGNKRALAVCQKAGMPESFISKMQKVADGSASSSEKRMWLKSYYDEVRKKGDGRFPKDMWKDYSANYGGWVSDVLNEDLLKGLQ